MSWIVAIPADTGVTLDTPIPTPKFLLNLSIASLVEELRRLLVSTLPSGSLLANDTEAGGFFLILSLSNCG